MFTVQDVAALEQMRRAEVRTAADRLDRRPVEWISVIEVPVEDFVRKNELVLTTAVGCGQDPAQLYDFVQEVIDAGAAALVVATGRYVFEIPERVLHMADERDFPIIELPWEVRFADVTQTVLGELLSRQHLVREQSEKIQQQLLHLILRGAGLSEIAETVRRKLQRPVLIVDHNGVILGKSNRSDELVAKWQSALQPGGTPYLPPSASPSELAPQQELSALSVADDTLLQMPIRSAREVQGSLIAPPPVDDPKESYLAQETAQVLEHAAIAAALWFLREKAVRETEIRMRDDFVWSLAKGEIGEWDDVISRAKSLGYNVSCPYICILGFPENLHALATQLMGHAPYEQRADEMLRAIEERIIESGAAVHCHLMSTCPREEFVLFLEVQPNEPAQGINLFLDIVENRFRKSFPGLAMSWGIGEYHEGTATFHASFQEARIALDIGRRQRGPGKRTIYADTGIYRALLRLSTDADMREISLGTIGALVDYGNRKHVDLIGTLTAYCRNHGNVSRTAKELNLHRQSLLYRLKKIEALTGRSLFHPDDRFLLDLSVRLWTMGLSHGEA